MPIYKLDSKLCDRNNTNFIPKPYSSPSKLTREFEETSKVKAYTIVKNPAHKKIQIEQKIEESLNWVLYNWIRNLYKSQNGIRKIGFTRNRGKEAEDVHKTTIIEIIDWRSWGWRGWGSSLQGSLPLSLIFLFFLHDRHPLNRIWVHLHPFLLLSLARARLSPFLAF